MTTRVMALNAHPTRVVSSLMASLSVLEIGTIPPAKAELAVKAAQAVKVVKAAKVAQVAKRVRAAMPVLVGLAERLVPAERLVLVEKLALQARGVPAVMVASWSTHLRVMTLVKRRVALVT